MFPSQRPQSAAKKTDGDATTATRTTTTTTTAASSSATARRPELPSSRRETDPLLGGGRGGRTGGGEGGSASTLRARRSSKSPVSLLESSSTTASASMLPTTTPNQESTSRAYDDSSYLPSHGSYEAIKDAPPAESLTAAAATRSRSSWNAPQSESLPFVAATGVVAAAAPPHFHSSSGGESHSGQSASGQPPQHTPVPQHHLIQSQQRSRGSVPAASSSSSSASSAAASSSSQQRRVLPPPPVLPRALSSPLGQAPASAASLGNRHHNHHHRGENRGGGSSQDDGSQYSQAPPPILEIPEEIYAVRKAALQVLKPLTKTWVVISVGFALTVLFGTARWTRLTPGLPFWFILLPCWSAHLGLLWLHVLSAQALSAFIADANESRQRPDSRDHLNRTEYLPLLQRSLKFGLKTGLLSFFVFAFEVLIYVRVARGTISLAAAFVPLWILVAGGIVDGLVCKTQHPLRVLCWILAFASMVMIVLKVDHQVDSLRWRVVVSPIVAVLSVASATLIYIVYGHQVGYYRLTESQLTAGNLYSLAALICIVLMVMIGEVIPLSRPVEIQTRLFVVILAPLVVCLVGMGAWVVSRDEFARLLLYGGQSAVHPMKLRWEAKGWTCVQGRGVVTIPMFGEVSFQPLERKQPTERVVELLCCQGSCYPYEDDDEETVHLTGDAAGPHHPYLDPLHSRAVHHAYRGL